MSRSGGTGGGGFKQAKPSNPTRVPKPGVQVGGMEQRTKTPTPPAKAPAGLGGAKKPSGITGVVKAIGKAVSGGSAPKAPKPTPTPQQKQNQRIDAINQIVPGVTFKKK